MLGLVGEHAADDEGLPVEAMALDGSGDVLGSISHDSTVRLWHTPLTLALTLTLTLTLARCGCGTSPTSAS